MDVRPLPVLAGGKVLIVKENFLQAEDTRQAVEAAAGDAIGPACSKDMALWLIEQDRPDAALLEVIVADRNSTPVAVRPAVIVGVRMFSKKRKEVRDV
jgi:hypothetical protein